MSRFRVDDDSTVTQTGPESERPSMPVTHRAYLVALVGSHVGEMYPLSEPDMVVGRSSKVDIRLDEEGISRRHARLVQMGNDFFIEDLKSVNGTFVNGTPIKGQTLKDGDKIRLGAATILKFTYHDRLDELFQRQMHDAALRDALTKTFNRRYFLHRLDTEFAYAVRHKSNLAIALFDIDHFKSINDKYGHVTGDLVLADIAKVASTALRTEDVLARYGGEEFAIVCRGIPSANVPILGERLRASIAEHAFEFDGHIIPVTASVGIATYPEQSVTSAVGLIGAADAALYEAKRGGRNRVVVAG